MCTTYIARIIVLWTFYIYRVILKKIQQCTHLYYTFAKGMYLILLIIERKSRVVMYQFFVGKDILSISNKILSYESIILIHRYHNHTVSKFLGNPGHSEMGVYHVPNVIVMACG